MKKISEIIESLKKMVLSLRLVLTVEEEYSKKVQ